MIRKCQFLTVCIKTLEISTKKLLIKVVKGNFITLLPLRSLNVEQKRLSIKVKGNDLLFFRSERFLKAQI